MDVCERGHNDGLAYRNILFGYPYHCLHSLRNVLVSDDHPVRRTKKQRTKTNRNKTTNVPQTKNSGSKLLTPPRSRRYGVQPSPLVPVESTGFPGISRGQFHEGVHRQLMASRENLRDDGALGGPRRSPNSTGDSGQHSKVGYKLFNLKNHAVPLKSEKQILRSGTHRKDSIATRVLAYAQVLPTIVTSGQDDTAKASLMTVEELSGINHKKPKSTLNVNLSVSKTDSSEHRLQSPISALSPRSWSSSKNSTSDPDGHAKTGLLSGSHSPSSLRSSYGFNVVLGRRGGKRFQKLRKRRVSIKWFQNYKVI